jgi:serine/threonine-protein kinase
VLAPDADPLIGTTVDGRWRVQRVIGAGLVGVVYEAERAQLGRKVALKVMHEQYAANDQFVRRFAREARVLSRLQHIHCVSILDVGSHAGRPYIVMELVAGQPLTAEIGAPTMTPVRAVQLMRQVLLALGHAHGHGVVHRDLKPDNIMVTELADVGPAVKVLDFGFAHFHDSRMSQSNSKLVPGTPSYMSPEQATGQKADHRADLYAAGIILYELCVGHKLFVAGDAMQMLNLQVNELPVRPRLAAPELRISAELDDVIMSALAKDREQRVQTAEEFRAALEATPEGREALGRAHAPRGGRLWIYGLVALALALAATVALYALRLRSP